MRYEDFTIEIATGGRGTPHARVLHSPGGGGSGAFDPPFGREELASLLRRVEGAVRGGGTERNYVADEAGGAAEKPLDPGEVGRQLFEGLFAGQVAQRWVYSRGRVDGDAERGLRLRLLLSPTATEAALPWELLCDPVDGSFLARGRRTPVVRCLDVPGAVSPPAADPPLRVLVALAAPLGAPPLDVAAERERIGEAWGRQPLVELDWLEGASLAGLRQRLRTAAGDTQVLHFVGHGDFAPVSGEGALLFEDGDGLEDPVTGRRLMQTLGDFPSLRLAFLNACDSASYDSARCDSANYPRNAAGADAYTSVAGALVAGGLPAVVAMQFPISDRAAVHFSGAFYQALASGDPLDGAVAEGRFAVAEAQPESYEWATPVLFLRGSGSQLLHGVVAEHRVPADVRRRIADHDVSELIEEKTRSFVGREFVFDGLERFLTEAPRGYFRVEGDPGIGKTALLAELVRRHDHPHHFNRRSEGVMRHEAFLGNVCSQLIARYGLDVPTLTPSSLDDGAFLSALLHRISDRLPRDRRCVVLVDALDESDSSGLPPGVNPLCLPATLPERVYLVVSARRGTAPTRVDVAQDGLTVVHDSAENLADVRRLVEDHLERPGIRAYRHDNGLEESAFVDLLVERSEGNFMYLSYVLPALEARDVVELTPRHLPSGLEGYYAQHWRLLQGGDETAWLEWKLPVVETLAVAEEPIPFDLLVRSSGVESRRHVRRALELWRPFLHVVTRTDAEGRTVPHYRVYHQSFQDFLARRTDLDDARARQLENLLDPFGTADRG